MVMAVAGVVVLAAAVVVVDEVEVAEIVVIVAFGQHQTTRWM